MAHAGRALVRVHPVMRAPPPRLAARYTPRARPGWAMPSRMGGLGGIRWVRPAQRGRGAVLVQAAAAERWLSFVEARELVRKVGLESHKEWEQWCTDGHRPSNIPSSPDSTYAGEGWQSWADWLDYDEGKPLKGSFVEFEEARAYVRKVGLESVEQWRQWCRDGHRPDNMPSNPNETYAEEGWLSWPDWLGFDEGKPLRGTFMEFEEARAFVRKAGLEDKKQWWQWCRDGHRPHTIPSNPDQAYGSEGWLSWADWLGYDEGKPLRGTFMEFEEARAHVWEMGLESQKQWWQWCRDGHRPHTIPYGPHKTYAGEGWLSWPDWLGYGEGQTARGRARKNFVEFEEARAYVQKVGLEDVAQWKKWCRDGHRPHTIPSNPNETYADEGWLSWADWLGFDEGKPLRGTFMEFEEARAHVWEMGLKSQKQWWQWCRDGHRPHTIPYGPHKTYAGEGWLSWADWLGYGEGQTSRTMFMEFEEARAYVREVGLEGKKQWEQWCRDGHRPDNIPSHPDRTYKSDGWQSWPDWLGYGEGRSPKRY